MQSRLMWIGSLAAILGSSVTVSPPARAQIYNGVTNCYDSTSGLASFCPGAGPSGPAPTRLGFDPCYLAQNALRPCRSDQRNGANPVGVDPNVVGTWELPFQGGPWVLKIERNGSYQFHSEAGDSAPSHSGHFAASEGHWSLKAQNGYSDAGLYRFQAPNVWIATGNLGAAAWYRPPLAKNAFRFCKAKQRQGPGASELDPDVVGAWELPLNGGSWVWEVRGDGTYQFHSEARDGAPSHSGTFSASNGHWSLLATTGYADSGVYLFQPPDIWIVAGRLGAAAWRHPTSGNASCR